MNDIKVMTMGVINITPNSFSDGGQYETTSSLETHLESLPTDSHFIWDIGAESTAPFNAPIEIEQERERLALILPLLAHFKPAYISLDTYRGETVRWFFDQVLTLGFKEDQLIWNDVSGCWDDEVKSFLETFKQSTYIYSHNRCPVRELTSHHMDYISDDDIVEQMITFFKDLSHPRVWFDPCFGFSKSYQQNWELISRWSEVLVALGDVAWVIGLSKKSFLRRFLKEKFAYELDKAEAMNRSESLHLELIRKFIKLGLHHCVELTAECKNPLIFRVHDSNIVTLASNSI